MLEVGDMYQETEKFKKCGKLFWPLVIGAVLLPFLLSLIKELSGGAFQISSFLTLAVVLMIFVVIAFVMILGNGMILSSFVGRTASGVNTLPYHFRQTYEDDVLHNRLYIDTDNGVIGYISKYNPFQIQIFNASRIDQMKTVTSSTRGISFVFYIDGKKIKMYTLMAEHVMYKNSAEAKEAMAEADKYVAYLQEAKRVAEQRRR